MLKKLFISFVREYLFWLAFFFVCRAIFLLYNLGEMKGIPFWEVISTFWHSLYLDTSMTCYFLGFSFLCYSLFGFFGQSVFLVINRVYVLLVLILFSLVTVAELKIYDEW